MYFTSYILDAPPPPTLPPLLLASRLCSATAKHNHHVALDYFNIYSAFTARLSMQPQAATGAFLRSPCECGEAVLQLVADIVLIFGRKHEEMQPDIAEAIAQVSYDAPLFPSNMLSLSDSPAACVRLGTAG